MFSTHLDNFLPFSSSLKLSSANYLSLEETVICHLGKGKVTFSDSFSFIMVIWESSQWFGIILIHCSVVGGLPVLYQFFH